MLQDPNFTAKNGMNLPAPEVDLDLDRIVAIINRQWRLIAVCAITTLLVSFGYLVVAVPKYTSSASILMDPAKQKLADQLTAVSGIFNDEAWILSQVEVIRSERLAKSVVTKLDLVKNPTFANDQGGALSGFMRSLAKVPDVLSWFASDDDNPVVISAEDAGNLLIGNLDVARVGETYVLSISYTSKTPKLAATIAKAYAEAYITDQLDSKYEATRRASDWLQDRIKELRNKSIQSDLAVQKFRADHGLLSTGGQLITEQQLGQLTGQLIAARGETANAEARFERIAAIVESNNLDAAVTESLESKVIVDLRSKYLEASRKEKDISTRLGPNHAQAIRLRGEMTEYERLMFAELSRIAQSYKSDLDVARSRQRNLEAQVLAATSTSANANDSQVQLRELEREADSYKKLYETFLSRYQEAEQQQTFPVSESRIISSPSVSTVPTSPKRSVILPLGFIAGIMVGGGLAALREFRERFFRTGDQIRQILDLQPLGIVPLVEGSRTIRRLPTPETSNIIEKVDSLSNYVIDHPLSLFAETLRSSKIAIDIMNPNPGPKAIGFVSALPGEGKTLLTINFAELLAKQGSRVLLIDGDIRNPGATRLLAPLSPRGLIEYLHGETLLCDLLLTNPATGIKFLPTISKRRVPFSAELLGSSAMVKLIEEVRNEYDYIIFDLPPLGPVVDARVIASKIDAFVFVVEWGETSRSMVKATLTDNREVADKCAGVILNKVDLKKLKFYENYGQDDLYYSRYTTS
jgi:succinoglycan biosynthesis transport protein ExoP